MRTGAIAAVVVLAYFGFDLALAASDAPAGPPPASESGPTLETVVVTGSRIPRTSVQGPAPVVTITADDIKNNGFATVSDVMSSLTQNLGSLENNQSTDGFSTGAQAVDLRGLGPNHTLVLVNGRRIADYPQAYQGNSNFTDISNIPASLIDRIEILSGSASAVYGSDAISGVINFIMKQKADGTTIDFRAGDTEHGGGDSQRLQFSTGYSNDRFDSIIGVELFNQQPLWAYQRDFTNSRLDSPDDRSNIFPSPVFLRQDGNDDYYPVNQQICKDLSRLDHGSIVYAYQPDYGPYCGSYQDVGYGTLENGRKAVNLYGSATYRINDSVAVFMDLQAGYTNQTSYNTPLQWQSSQILDDNSTPTPFFNRATGLVEQWQRKYFTIEENGGFQNGEIHNFDKTLSVNTGVKGTLPGTNWNYEALFGHSQNGLEAKEPAIVSAKAQTFFLGPQMGTMDGLNAYYAPEGRLYTPLTVAQFQSITQVSVDNDKSRTENFSLTANNTKLFMLPAGPVGFAAVGEYGSQYFGLKADPLSLDGSYYGLHNTTAVGSRNHYGLGAEFNIPVFTKLTATAAGRYDSYRYSGTSTGKFTYAGGLEYRPIDSLLMRGSYSTGFRAPDLSFLYSGLSGSSSDDTDYYFCRKVQPDTGPSYGDCDRTDVDYDGRSHGSISLKDETSTSFTYGVVFSPFKSLEITADYYRIKLNNEVEYQSSDTILREEADCRLGVTTSGQPVNINSTQCQEVLSQVARSRPLPNGDPGNVTSVLVFPINAASDRTSGIDFSAHYVLTTDVIGNFDFNFGITDVLTHTIQLFPGDPVDNELTDWYYYVIPRNKASYSVAWSIGPVTTTVHGSRLGGLPNYDGTERLGATAVYNASINYRFSARSGATFIVDNVFDTRPQRDPSWTSYPYYSSNWFSPIGRAFFVELNYRFGGKE